MLWPKKRPLTSSACLSGARGPAGAGKRRQNITPFRDEPPPTCLRIGDNTRPPALSDFDSLADGSADKPLPIPSTLPARTPKSDQPRFAESSVYPYLETNVDFLPMEFTQEPIPAETSERSVAIHGADTPFRHWQVIRRYLASLLERNGYEDLVEYSTTVENVEKVGAEWKVTLRKEGKGSDYWWVEWFDAVVVASGHYWVPKIPKIKGLEEFERGRPGSVLHSKHFRGRDQFKDKVCLPPFPFRFASPTNPLSRSASW